MDDIWQRRLTDLAGHVDKDLQLLREYEDALRHEDDPRRQGRYRRDIERLHGSAREYQRELTALKGELSTAPTGPPSDLVPRLHQMDAKLDLLIAGQRQVGDDLADLRRTLVRRYNPGEQDLVGATVEHLDGAQLETIRALLDALEDDRLPDEAARATVEATREALASLPPGATGDAGAQQVASVLAAPGMDTKHKLKVSLPIIPLLLTYEGEVTLGSELKLSALWDRLVRTVRREPSP